MIQATEPCKKPRTHRVRKVIRIFLLTVVTVLAVLFSFHYAATLYEQERNPAPGVLVSVNGKKMHVYSVGQGKPTFVLLSGGGVGAPVLELNPLLSRFAKAARTVVAEYPGYGWSEDTDAPRTSQAIVEEIRAALKSAGIKPPYVLVGHSVGGLYATAYAQSHADELSAVVLLDSTLPRALMMAKAQGQSVQQSLPPMGAISLLRKAGVLRLMLWANPLLVSGAPQGVYTDAEARRIAMVTGWNYGSNALVHEFAALEGNMAALADASFPATLPVLIFQANADAPLTEAYQWSLAERKRLTQDLAYGKVIELPAGHSSIYWYLSETIVQDTLAFLRDAKVYGTGGDT